MNGGLDDIRIALKLARRCRGRGSPYSCNGLRVVGRKSEGKDRGRLFHSRTQFEELCSGLHRQDLGLLLVRLGGELPILSNSGGYSGCVQARSFLDPQ
jgi:hypothetical protein